MSLLRPSIAGRLLRAGTPSVRRAVPATIRFESSTVTLSTPLTPSGKPGTSVDDVKEHQPRHNQPDYTAEVDQASS
jgi:NADH dehydrogenase (ubiquinone) Fe-S protein 4